MKNFAKWTGIVLGGIAAIALAAAGIVYISSEIILDRTYAFARSELRTAVVPESTALGAHLVQISGCADCHGNDLAGVLFDDMPPGTVLWSANLPLLARTYSPADFDHAIRQGLRPDGTSVILMPSNSYAAMHDEELAAIVAYIRSLPAKGQDRPAPVPGMIVRLGLVLGKFETTRAEFDGRSPLDLGRKYEAGRHLAQLSCSECHGNDLGGGAAIGPMPQRPDLALVAAYDRGDFLKFMRTGKAAGNRELILMSSIARARFSHFTDAEANALYDYLAARGRNLVAKPGS
ncbi:MAG TPA: cytochrome c [Rhizomicrobium sp.]